MIPLVVRPAAQATELEQLLRQHGHAPLCCPLLETVAGSDLPRLPETAGTGRHRYRRQHSCRSFCSRFFVANWSDLATY